MHTELEIQKYTFNLWGADTLGEVREVTYIIYITYILHQTDLGRQDAPH